MLGICGGNTRASREWGSGRASPLSLEKRLGIFPSLTDELRVGISRV